MVSALYLDTGKGIFKDQVEWAYMVNVLQKFRFGS